MVPEDSEPIHTWFDLSYASHLVLDPARTRHLSPEWRDETDALLDQLAVAFPDASAGVEVLALAAQESEYGELTDEQMRALDISTNADDLHEGHDHQDEDEVADCEESGLYYYDWLGTEHEHLDRVMVPLETEDEARAAGRRVEPRTLLQSMPTSWQARLVALLRQCDDVDTPSPEAYDIRFYTAAGRRTTDPVPHYRRGRTRIEPRLEALA